MKRRSSYTLTGSHWMGTTGISCEQAKKSFFKEIKIPAAVATGLRRNLFVAGTINFTQPHQAGNGDKELYRPGLAALAANTACHGIYQRPFRL